MVLVNSMEVYIWKYTDDFTILTIQELYMEMYTEMCDEDVTVNMER